MQHAVRRRDLFRLPVALALRPRPWPGGTFLQFWPAHLGWDEPRWVRLYGSLAELGVTELAVQWSRYDGVDYLPLVLRAAAECDARGWGLHAGLAGHSQWWKALDEGHAARKTALARAFAAHLDCAGRLAPLARRRCFRGWYLPEEIDDVHWLAEGDLKALSGHISGLRCRLRPLTVSGFSGGRTEAELVGALWRRLCRESHVNTVFFQDGIGAGNLTMAQWERLLPVLARAAGPGRLRVVVEAFESVDGSGVFRARPAPVDRLVAQTALARRFTRGAPIAFSFPEYYTPEGGEEAGRGFDELRHSDMR